MTTARLEQNEEIREALESDTTRQLQAEVVRSWDGGYYLPGDGVDVTVETLPEDIDLDDPASYPLLFTGCVDMGDAGVYFTARLSNVQWSPCRTSAILTYRCSNC